MGVVAAAPATAEAQKPAAAAPVWASAPAGPTTPERAHALLAALSDDSLQGRHTGSPGASKAAAMIARQMAAIGLKPAGDSGYFQKVASSGNSEDLGVNVVGILPGTDPKLGQENIVVGAHYDHLGMADGGGGDSIYNGADDDASGVIAVLEAARQLAAGPKPKRTIVFAAFTGEEEGAIGSGFYLNHPVLPLDSMVAELEVEMIGRPDSLAGGSGHAWLTGYERSTMGDALAKAGIPIVADPHPEENFFYRSDNIIFAKRGIVAHTLSSFNLHEDYHQVTDDVSRVDAKHIAAVINATASTVRLLADGERPAWKPGGKP